MLPRVTVSILSYRRFGPLVKVLESVRRQDYPNVEVIVVDNGSDPELAEGIERRFPQTRVIRLPENIGAAARNHAIAQARGEYLVTLDNDVYFDAPHALREVLAAFERHPRAGCVVFRVCHPSTGRVWVPDWCHPRPWQAAECEEFETYYITEGAAAFRRALFEQVEPYWPALFIGHEGFDLALRILDAGCEIWYTPRVKVWHLASPEARPSWRSFYYFPRNLFAVVYRNYPWAEAVAHLVPRLALFGLYALRAGAFRHFARGMWDGLRMIHACRGVRRPVSRTTLSRIREMDRFQPGLGERFRLGAQRMLASLR